MAAIISEAFMPRWYSVFYNPFYIIRSRLSASIIRNAPYINGKTLDFGCGSKPYRNLFKAEEYIGLDYETEVSKKNSSLSADIFYDGKHIPFDNDHFNSVFSSEVVEHVFNPDEIFSEIARVLKPGGHFLFTCPFFWPEHEQPYDYARYTSFALKHLMDKYGMEIINYEKTGSYFESMLQGIVLYVYYFIPHKPKILAILFFSIFITPFLFIGLVLAKVLPSKIKRSDFYLNNVVVARKI